jgi:hypothetical protein
MTEISRLILDFGTEKIDYEVDDLSGYFHLAMWYQFHYNLFGAQFIKTTIRKERQKIFFSLITEKVNRHVNHIYSNSINKTFKYIYKLPVSEEISCTIKFTYRINELICDFKEIYEIKQWCSAHMSSAWYINNGYVFIECPVDYSLLKLVF